MGVTGVLISSSAGGLGIVLSIIAIRRKLRGRKSKHREVSTESFPGSAIECSDAAVDRDIAFVKTGTADLLSKRSAVIIHSLHDSSVVDSSSHEHTIQTSHALHKRDRREDHPVTKAITADEVSRLDQDERVTASNNAIQGGSEPVKEFTTQASNLTSAIGVWEDDFEALELRENPVVNYDRAPNESGSETDSCSFTASGYLPEEERREVAEDWNVTEIRFEMPKAADQNGKQDNGVSFQLEACASQQQGPPHCEIDSEDLTKADMNKKNAIEEREDTILVMANDEKAVDTSTESRVPSSVIDDSDSPKEDWIPKVHDAMIETESVSDFATTREVTQRLMRSEDQNLGKAKASSFVSVEPLPQMPALDDIMTASPMLKTLTEVRKRKNGPSVEFDITPLTEMQPYECNQPEYSQALSLPKEYSQDSRRSSDVEKENNASSAASSQKKLSRKPRRGTERSGMFRRRSHPALKRFRFSDRIKALPLRPSGRSSN